MAFETPDLRSLITKTQADIEAELPGSNARLRRSNLNVLGRVQAGVAHGMYGFIREFLSQCLPWSKGFLVRQWAEIWKVQARPAVAAERPATFTGANGSLIEADTRLQAVDGREYATLADVTVIAGTAIVTVIAIEPGAAGNVDGGTVLSLVNPVAGVNADATVGAGGVTGIDAESVDSLYKRFEQRVQSPPHGGSEDDYKSWALEVPGVTQAWVYTDLDGEDTIQVFFVRDDDASPIPDAAEVTAVQDYINAPNRKPLTAAMNVYAPVAKLIDFTVEVVPNTPAVRAAVEQELKDFVRRVATLGGTVIATQADEAISLAQGETDHTMTLPAANITCLPNEYPVFGAITWIGV
jgi:uncharacterized phage protein gp47/JayE